jgi:hypothetical protein
MMGDRDGAIQHARQQVVPGLPSIFRLFYEMTIARLEERHAQARTAADAVLRKWRLRDPCGNYYLARTLASMQHPDALPMLRRVVDDGFHCYPFFARDPWLDAVRAQPEFDEIARQAEAGYRASAEVYAAAGGEQILGPVSSPTASPLRR